MRKKNNNHNHNPNYNNADDSLYLRAYAFSLWLLSLLFD